MTAPSINLAILTVSDRCAGGQAEDVSGPRLGQIATMHLTATVVATACVPDEIEAIASQLQQWAGRGDIDLILTTGGTGLAPRDVTPEATLTVLDKRHTGLLELARMRCYAKTPRAYLSRGEAGTVGRTLIINLPGSPNGAAEFLEALLDVLPHAIRMTRGADTDHR